MTAEIETDHSTGPGGHCLDELGRQINQAIFKKVIYINIYIYISAKCCDWLILSLPSYDTHQRIRLMWLA